jgi:hypothetical protein
MSDTVHFDTWDADSNIQRWLLVSAYCDRWCERCRHRTRCLMAGAELEDLVAMLDEPGGDPEAEALEALEAEEAAREQLEAEGLSELHVSVSPMPRLDGDPLLEQSRIWSEITYAWLDARPPEREARELREVLGWHASLVPNKIARCLIGLHFMQSCEHCRAAGSKDHQGSAKVAALGLHACIGVLARWCQARPLDEQAMGMLIASCELLEALQLRVPDHMSFVRPGLED